MLDLSSCPRCTRPIPPDAPGGSCPACLLGLALETPADAADPTPESKSATASAAPPDADLTATYPGARPAAWPTVDGYEILGELGAGGGGAVYRARQLVADRDVAVKVLFAGGSRVRFDREVRALAGLDHPHVVRVFEVGECDQGPFFSMELMPGGTLAARVRRDGPLAPADAAAVVEQAARGVAAAHGRNIAHRDMKPSNILLAADGTPKVADFGLAKEWQVAPDGPTADPPTAAGGFLGTPQYAAPEQAAGRTGEHRATTDVYGLGAVLYQALTGDPPFPGDNVGVVLHQILTEDPIPPRAKRRDLPRELEAVCLKCLSKNPAARYSSAAAVADDLGRWRRGEPTVARPVPRLVRAARWGWRRRRAWARGLGIAAATALVLGAAGYLLVPAAPDPDAELKTIRRELAAGGEVVLLGPAGRPRWHRWEGGTGEFAESSANDPACSFQAVSDAFLVLLPAEDVPRAFRLRAEVRHERSAEPAGFAGVFLFRQQEEVGGGYKIRSWREVGYNDFPAFPARPDGKVLPNFLICRAYVDLQPPNRPAGWGTNWNDCKLEITSGPTHQPRPWRTIRVEYTAAGLRCWAAVAGGPEKPFAPPLVAAAALEQKTLAEQATGLAQVPLADPRRDPRAARGALGLFLRLGHASFRNVVIEPLPE